MSCTVHPSKVGTGYDSDVGANQPAQFSSPVNTFPTVFFLPINISQLVFPIRRTHSSVTIYSLDADRLIKRFEFMRLP